MPRTTPTPKQTTQTKAATPKGGNAAELFERGHRIIHGKAPTGAASTTLPVQPISTPTVKIVEQIRQGVRDDLKQRVETFTAEASQEEIRFLVEVLKEWDSQFHNKFFGLKSPLEREVPFFNALQYTLNGKLLVEVPDVDMIPLVERFIRELDERPAPEWRGKSTKVEGDANEDLCRGEFNVFLRAAGEASVDLMRAIFARWNDLDNDPSTLAAIKDGRLVNLLAVAIDIELPGQLAAKALRSLKG